MHMEVLSAVADKIFVSSLACNKFIMRDFLQFNIIRYTI